MGKSKFFLEFFGAIDDAVTSLSPAIGATSLISTNYMNVFRFENEFEKCSKKFEKTVDLGLEF
jgi:hypothetical protein